MREERLDAARVAALFGVARSAWFATLANAGLLLFVLWDAVPSPLLIAWFGTLLALLLVRLGLQRGYEQEGQARHPRRWETRFALGAFAAGALWAVPPALFFPPNEPLLQMAVIFVVGGNIIAATAAYAPSRAAFYGFSVLPLASIVCQLTILPGRAYSLLALMVVVFSAVMLRVFREMNRNVTRTLRTQIDNDELVGRLAQSEAQMRDAIESFPDGIAVYDAQDRLVVCNKVYARVYGAGRGAAQLAGASYPEIAQNAYDAEIVPPEYAGRREEWLADRLARRQSGAGAVRHYRTGDGRSLQGLFVKTAAGGIVSVFHDVTELRQAQDAYGEVLAEEAVVLDTLPVGVVFFTNRIIVRCNRRLEQMLGYAAGELSGQSSRVLYPSEALWTEAGERYKLLAHGGVLEGEFKLRCKDGTDLWCHSVGRTLNPGVPGASTTIVTYSDTSERHAAQRALRKSEGMYRSLVETSNDLIWSVDLGGRWTYLSPGATRRIYGCQPAEMVGREFRERLAAEVSERDVAVFSRIAAGESVFDFETRHVRRDGTHVDLSFNAVPLRDSRGTVIGSTGTARDITAEKIAAATLYENVEKLRLAVDAAELMYWEWERDTDQLQWGRDPSTLVGSDGGRTMRWSEYLDMVHPEDKDRYMNAITSAWEQAGACSNEYRVIRRDGRVVWLSSHGRSLADGAGRVRRMIGVSQDITERKRQEEEARFLAYHDTLTGLPNRRLLDDRLRQAVFLAQRRDARVAVMVIDLDHFKQVNDALGHRAGDAVLREAAHRIAGCVRKADTLARQGGDEFVVVIPDMQLDADGQVVAEKILRALEPPFRVDGRDFVIGASIGVSVYPTDAGDGEGVLRNADVAMYRAKQLGRNNYRYYGR